MKLLLDADGVIFDYMGGFKVFAEKVYGVRATSDLPKTYNLECWMPDITQTQVREMIHAFNHTKGSGFENLKPLPGVLDFIKKMQEAGADMSIITKASRSGITAQMRLANIEALFPQAFQDVVLLDMSDSKAEAFSRFNRSVWVDDLPIHVEEGIEAGHESFLMAQLYNADARHLEGKRIDALDEVSDIVLNLESEMSCAPS